MAVAALVPGLDQSGLRRVPGLFCDPTARSQVVGRVGRRALPKRTSAKKDKRIDDNDLARLLGALRRSTVASDADLAAFLDANLLVGWSAP